MTDEDNLIKELILNSRKLAAEDMAAIKETSPIKVVPLRDLQKQVNFMV